jgi:hypothetical protein
MGGRKWVSAEHLKRAAGDGFARASMIAADEERLVKTRTVVDAGGAAGNRDLVLQLSVMFDVGLERV